MGCCQPVHVAVEAGATIGVARARQRYGLALGAAAPSSSVTSVATLSRSSQAAELDGYKVSLDARAPHHSGCGLAVGDLYRHHNLTRGM